MSGDRHRDRLRNARADHVANRRTPKIVEEPPRDLRLLASGRPALPEVAELTAADVKDQGRERRTLRRLARKTTRSPTCSTHSDLRAGAGRRNRKPGTLGRRGGAFRRGRRPSRLDVRLARLAPKGLEDKAETQET